MEKYIMDKGDNDEHSEGRGGSRDGFSPRFD
jgi:hypothetical protein